MCIHLSELREMVEIVGSHVQMRGSLAAAFDIGPIYRNTISVLAIPLEGQYRSIIISHTDKGRV